MGRVEKTRMPAGVNAAPEQEGYAELAELAGGFIHEIKNHLSTLGLNLHLLTEDFQSDTLRERRALGRIQRLQSECQRLVDLSNDFLRFARVKDLELVPSSLATVMEEMVDFFGPMARQANIEIKCYLPANLPAVKLNQDLFKQTLLNLLLNAAQAIPQGGELTGRVGTPGGTGLGLATSRRIIRAHGGRLSVESEVGKGTKFTIRLPAETDAA